MFHMPLRLMLAAVAAVTACAASAAPIPVVAAENFYGDIARQIGGDQVRVTSILTNPDQDPHLFEASPSVARALAGARVVVTNGVGYDPWMDKLLAASGAPGRVVVVAGDLVGKHAGDNPHIWYDPAVAVTVADALAEAFGMADAAHVPEYMRRLAAFRDSLAPVQGHIAALRGRVAGAPVTATEPVLGVLFGLLGMEDRNAAFQRAVMNDTEPGASDIAAFEGDLKGRRVRMLVYNSQASSPMAARMARLARAQGVTVVGATETEPAGVAYQAWMARTVDAIDKALPSDKPPANKAPPAARP